MWNVLLYGGSGRISYGPYVRHCSQLCCIRASNRDVILKCGDARLASAVRISFYMSLQGFMHIALLSEGKIVHLQAAMTTFSSCCHSIQIEYRWYPVHGLASDMSHLAIDQCGNNTTIPPGCPPYNRDWSGDAHMHVDVLDKEYCYMRE
jgi:hypothetical protein